MEKNSPTYNNKRFAQRTDNYQDYERNTGIPTPAARFVNTFNFLDRLPGGLGVNEEEDYYPISISNAAAFLLNANFADKFKEEINKFISFMKMLNNGQDARADQPKVNWLRKNKNSLDQYNEFTNWSQSERQKYSSRFNTMLGTKRGAILQKALVALKNAEIAAAKFAFPNDPGVKGAEFMTDAEYKAEELVKPVKPSNKPSEESKPSEVAQKPQKTYEKFNYSYIPFVKKIKTGNDLLFFSAMQALGMKIGEYSKENESSYYTKDNHNKIQEQVNKIADSEYLNKINPLLSKLKQAALDKLFDKVGGLDVKLPSDVPAESEGTGMAGSMTTSTGPDGEQKVSSSVQTEAGNEVRRLLDIAEGLDNNQLQRLWRDMLESINTLMRNPQIDVEEKVEFDQRIKDIMLRYNSAFYPEGGEQLSSGTFVVNTPEALARILRAALRVDDVTAANDAVNKLKIIFEENSNYRDYQILRKQLAIEINRYNFGKDELVNKL